MAAAQNLHIGSAAAHQQTFSADSIRQQGGPVIPANRIDDGRVVPVAHYGLSGNGDAVVRIRGPHRIADFIDDFGLGTAGAENRAQHLRRRTQHAAGSRAHCQHHRQRRRDDRRPPHGTVMLFLRHLGLGSLSSPRRNGRFLLLCKMQGIQFLLIIKLSVHRLLLPEFPVVFLCPGPNGCAQWPGEFPGSCRSLRPNTLHNNKGRSPNGNAPAVH